MALSLAWSTHDGADCLLLSGDDARLAGLADAAPEHVERFLRVYPTEILDAAGGTPGLLQPQSGSYRVDVGGVRFIPRHAFMAGRSYTMLVGDSAALTVVRPTVEQPPTTTVVEIHPTAPTLPRNALRFYVHFSAPMSEGCAAAELRLERADTGEPLAGAFAPLEPELWDPEHRRLTVFLDPARIKRGLSGHRELGYPLRTGVPVRLVVGSGFLDGAGLPLMGDHHRAYEVGSDVRRRVDPAGWRLSPPAATSREPLVLHFDRPLDHALVQRCLTVRTDDGRLLPGAVEVPDGEAAWSFIPAGPWQPVPHHVGVDPVLEDLAGNSLRRVFDRDLEGNQDVRDYDSLAEGLRFIPFESAS